MIRIYAFEPSAAVSWQRFRFVFSQVGCSHGRLIAAVPRRWEHEVWKCLKEREADQNDIKRITERMAASDFKLKFITRDSPDFRPDQEWLANVIAEHRRHPFAAILTEQAHGTEPSVIAIDDLDEGHRRWQVERTQRVRRTAAAMAALVNPLLTISTKVIFVDPYFLRGQSLQALQRWLQPLKAFIGCCGPRVQPLEYHTGDQERPTPAKRHFEQHIAPLLTPGQRLDVVLWPQDGMHNRFILTDLGGINFGHGLDEGSGHDDVGLLDTGHWKSVWNHHQSSQGQRRIIVEGRASRKLPKK